MRVSASGQKLITAAKRLAKTTEHLRFGAPVTYVYHPLRYAWKPHEMYIRIYGRGPKRIIFLGMNPGPFGMAQTGVPFGEVAAVRQWLRIEAGVSQPLRVHPRRPVTGFACNRSEVSGRRLWRLFAQRFGDAEAFFADHFVLNYCPLAFLEAGGRNRTPNQLPRCEREALFEACDAHLRAVAVILEPEWLIGVGDFACQRAQEVFALGGPRVGRILHPSPASPAANRDWAGTVIRQMQELGVWA